MNAVSVFRWLSGTGEDKYESQRVGYHRMTVCRPTEICSFLPHTYTDSTRRPRGSQSGREKGRDESFQVGAKKPLGTDSHRAISKNSSGCRLLIGHKKCFVLLCPIGEQFLLSSFCEFVHDGYRFDHGLSGSCTKEMHTVRKLSV